MLLSNKEVAIIGGGPGGLTLARLLQMKGVKVKVYERDFNASARVQGATLDLHYGSGLKAVEEMGLMDVFKTTYRPGNEKGRVMDKYANMVYDEHAKNRVEDFNSPNFRPEIDRGPLRDMLLHSLEPDTVVWDSHLTSLTSLMGKWQLKFKNGTTAAADLVIGADGANSKVRPLVTPVKAFYAGVIILQGNIPNAQNVVPELHELVKGGKISVHGDEKFLYLSSKGNGSIDMYMSFKKAEDWVQQSDVDFSNRVQLRSWFIAEFPGWSSLWLDAVEHADLPMLIRPQFCIPVDQTWEAHTDITLLGDAAHIMPPSGEGVNLAMLDAVELSDCLTNGKYADIQSAIAAYEEPMRIRASKEAAESLKMVDWMHSDDALEIMAKMFSQ